MRITILKQSFALLLSASVLAACGGSSDDPTPSTGDSNQSLTFAYPSDGQTEIATPAPVVLRFTDEVRGEELTGHVTLVRLSDGQEIDYQIQPVASDARSVLLQPKQPLDPQTDYEVRIQGLTLEAGPVGDDTIAFTTRPLQRGPKNAVITSDDFALTRAFPSGDEQEPVMDFSTFRFQFTQPIDPATARYGLDGSVALLDADGQLVDAILLVDGPYMTVDPRGEYLTPGQDYTLHLGDQLVSAYGVAFEGDELDYTPKDSSPGRDPVFLTQVITKPGDPNTGDGTSTLTGKPINQVPVNSTLLGNDSATQSEGTVRAELASTVDYPTVTPIRIDRETLLTGSNIDVMIGGAVPAGIKSGAVKMHFLSDATGYMVPNPYDPDGLRLIKLFMDVAIATEEAEANGGFTQDLLHIELVGLSEIDPSQSALNLDAVSMVEPDVLGQEFANGLLSFQLRSLEDQTNPPPPSVDTNAPTLQSWTFGEDQATGLDKTAMIKPTDPIILNFSEPLDRQSVIGKVHLYQYDGVNQLGEVDTTVTVDGGAIVIKPVEPLQHPTETGADYNYQVVIDSGITDLSGMDWDGATAQGMTLNGAIELGALVEEAEVYRLQFVFGQGTVPVSQGVQPVKEKSAFVMGVYPGYPCPLNVAARNLSPAAGQPALAGRCRGSMQPNTPMDDIPGQDELGGLEPLPADDILPVPDLPANRPIVIVFSEAIDPASLFNDQGEAVTFEVSEIDPDNPDIRGSDVPGLVSLDGNTLKFMPENPWEEGKMYAYRLISNGDMTSPATQCNANQAGANICGQDGLPVNTQLLAEVSANDQSRVLPATKPPVYTSHYIWEEKSPNLIGGGPDLMQYFTGAPASKNVLQLLRLPQTVDRNANLINDSTFPLDAVITGGSLSQDDAEFPAYQINETLNNDWQADGSTANLFDPIHDPNDPTPLDPNGVRPPPNSAKVLSSFFGYREIAQIDDSVLAFGAGQAALGQSANSAGANVGCGWVETKPFEDQTDCDQYGEGFFGKTCYYAEPAECPEDKFTYLHGVLFAEVTDEVTPNGELKVRIFPGHIVTTSFRVYTKSATGSGGEIVDSGYQVMRMRYPAGEQFIEGMIAPGTKPMLSTTVDLYMDAPYLVTDLTDVKNWMSEMNHNLYSYPVQMSLSGGIEFLSDGRMVVEQFNDNAIEINQRANQPVTHVDFMVPAKGSYLRYVSEPIKQ